MLAVLYLLPCTRCNGDTYLDRDHWGAFLKCLQCGRECVVPDEWVEEDSDPQP